MTGTGMASTMEGAPADRLGEARHPREGRGDSDPAPLGLTEDSPAVAGDQQRVGGRVARVGDLGYFQGPGVERELDRVVAGVEQQQDLAAGVPGTGQAQSSGLSTA